MTKNESLYKNANMAQNDSQWHKMTLYGSEWLRMTQNDLKGLQRSSEWLNLTKNVM